MKVIKLAASAALYGVGVGIEALGGQITKVGEKVDEVSSLLILASHELQEEKLKVEDLPGGTFVKDTNKSSMWDFKYWQLAT